MFLAVGADGEEHAGIGDGIDDIYLGLDTSRVPIAFEQLYQVGLVAGLGVNLDYRVGIGGRIVGGGEQ